MTQVFGESFFNEDVTFFGQSNFLGSLTILDYGVVNNSITSPKFIVPLGTSSGFLKADGSVDTTTYLSAATVGGTSDNVAGQIVSRNGFGGFSAGIITATSSFRGNLTGNLTGNVNASGVSTITTLKVNSIQNLSGIDVSNKIVQVITSKNDSTLNGSSYITSTSWTDSGYSATITPKISGSTMIITINGRLGSSYGTYIDHFWQIRDGSGTVLPGYTNNLQYVERLQTGSGTSYLFMSVYHTNVTSTQTYKLYGQQSGGNGIFIFEPVIWTIMEVQP